MDEKQNGGVGRKAKVERSARETVDTSNSKLHYKVTGGS